MAKKKGPQAWQAAAGGGPAKADPGYRWKSADARPPGSGKRWVKRLALLGGLLACVAAFVVTVRWLQPPPHPKFVAIAADPSLDAEKLDVPIDPYGWAAAQQVLAWARDRDQADAGNFWNRRAKPSGSEPDTPTRLSSEPDKLQEWADGLSKSENKTVVVYVGLHGGVDDAGPFFFTGGRNETTKGPNKLPVKALLQALGTGEMGKTKRVLLLLDNGRLAPDPAYGQLHDGFAAAVHDLHGQAKYQNLVVICGAGVGQRGWESEEWQTTAFAHGLLAALRNESRGTKIVTAQTLHEEAKGVVGNWVHANRTGEQVPFLLSFDSPDPKIELNVHRTPDPQTPVEFTAPDSFTAHWKKHDALAADPAGPVAYTPRLWRRYRELLLRYEFVLRAGNQTTAARLHTLLNQAELDLTEKVRFPAAELKSLSDTNSLALWSALQLGGAAPGAQPAAATATTQPADRISLAHRTLLSIREAPPAKFASALQDGAARLGGLDRDRRPAEAHLPVMVQDFYGRVGQPAPAEWASAFRTQQAAERAALGLSFPPEGQPPALGGTAPVPLACERVWPMIAGRLGALDDARRRAEDHLFSDDPTDRKTAADALKTAGDGYAEIARLADVVRIALDVRDTVWADLPFLARWVAGTAETDRDPRVEQVAKLGAKLRELADLLDRREPGRLEATAREAESLYKDLLQVFRTDLNKELPSAAHQKAWVRKQVFLATPFVPAESRVQLLANSRRDSHTMLKENRAGDPVGNRTGPEGAAGDHQQVLARAKLIRAVLDAATPDASAVVTGNLEDLRTSKKWAEIAVEIGNRYVEHARGLSVIRPPTPPAIDLANERKTRAGVVLEPGDKDEKLAAIEPALANRWLQWRTLLAGLAARAADDHWYDEKHSSDSPDKNPDALAGRYFRRAAKRYLDDVETVADRLPPGPPKIDPPKSLAAPPLTSMRPADPVTWTSERRQDVTLALDISAEFPVKGTAVGFVSFDGKKVLAVEKPVTRKPYTLGPRLKLDVPLTFAAKDEANDECKVAGAWYFRGQWPTCPQPIAVRRRPNLILADPLPTEAERGVSFDVRARNDVDVGPVVILIDYSGSMLDSPAGENLDESKDVEERKKNPKSKYQQALTAVDAAVSALPPTTPLAVRIFSQKRSGEARGPLSTPVYTVSGGEKIDVEAVMVQLRKATPYGGTPLVEAITAAVHDDFPRQPKTLVVVTDGVQTVEDVRVASPGEIKETYRPMLTEQFKSPDGRYVALFVVNFGLSEKKPPKGASEKELSAALFCHIDKHPVPGRVWDATNQADLASMLRQAILPKLRVKDNAAVSPPTFPPAGWPSRPFAAPAEQITDIERSKLSWSPLVPAVRYEATAVPSGRPVNIEAKDGDRLLLGFHRAAGGGVRVRRELYADFFAADRRTPVGTDKPWVLTVPGSSVARDRGEPEFRAFGFVEHVPSHRRRTPDGRDAADNNETLVQAVPSLLWWEVGPTESDGRELAAPPGPLNGTVTVRRRYAYQAPAWEITATKWPGLKPASVRAYAVKAEDAPQSEWKEVPRLGEEMPIDVAGRHYLLRATIEPYRLGPGGAEIECLIVRVTCKDEKAPPLLVQLEPLGRLASEHRFYLDAKASTAAFGELSRESLSRVRFRATAVDTTALKPQAISLVTQPQASPTVEYDKPPTPYTPKDSTAPAQKCE